MLLDIFGFGIENKNRPKYVEKDRTVDWNVSLEQQATRAANFLCVGKQNT